MVFDTSLISPECATELLRRFTRSRLAVTGMTRLHGGMVNSVLELTTDGEPARVVAKLSGKAHNAGFEHEFQALEWYRRHTSFPVPEPFGVDTSGDVFPGSCLMMERLPGENLAQVALTTREAADVERRMACSLAGLHGLLRPTYGFAYNPLEAGQPRWLDWLAPKMQTEFEAAADRLSATARHIIERELARLGAWLPESGGPTLVHGDVWATNVIVDPLAPGGPALSGFVDGRCQFADVEYELAYLLVFRTVGQAFFDEYMKRRPIRDGFERRCRVYWLHTMLLHVRAFGDAHYIRACEGLARELDRLGPP
jgi:fructosamine-3-kinase